MIGVEVKLEDREPYTYLIGWSKLNKWYYGVRFGKGCHPSELWVKYFTSSEIVSKFREENGNPDVIQVRKIFKSQYSAKEWEDKVLRRIPKEKRSLIWLNRKFDAHGGIIANPLNMRKPKKDSSKMGKYKRTPSSLLRKKYSTDYTKTGAKISSTHKNKKRIINLLTNEIKFKFEGEDLLKDWILWEDLPTDLKKKFQYNLGDVGRSGRGKIWVTNSRTGENRKIPINENVPFGFIKGKTQGKSK